MSSECWRLYSKEKYERIFQTSTRPGLFLDEIKSVILHLKKLGFNDGLEFDFMDSPAIESLLCGVEELHGW